MKMRIFVTPLSWALALAASMGSNFAVQAGSTPDEGADIHPDFELRSFAKLGGDYVFSIYHKPSGRAEWASQGDQVKGLAVGGYDEASRTLQVEADDRAYVLWLRSTSSFFESAESGDVAQEEAGADRLAERLPPRFTVAPRTASRQVGMIGPPSGGNRTTMGSPEQRRQVEHSQGFEAEPSIGGDEFSGGSPSPGDISHGDIRRNAYRVAPRTVVNSDLLEIIR